MKKTPMHVPERLNEAYHYAKPVPFSRGLRLELGSLTALIVSGTASVDDEGKSVHIGDLKAQARRTYDNISELLKSENMSWHDVVHTRIYLRDIDRDYTALSEFRMAYFEELGIETYPASTCVEARLCRPELLVEVEVIAVRDNADE